MIEFYRKDGCTMTLVPTYLFVMNGEVWGDFTEYCESGGLDYETFMESIEPMTELDWREV